jgi:disulfide bond formation protein DsbB
MAGAAALRWHDGIHYLGLVNAVLAVLTLLGGLVLFLGFQVQGKKWNEPARKTIRAVHMTAGTIAIAAGLAHYLGRSVQIGHLWWGPNPPTFAMLGFLLLLISGILRYKKPWAIMPWLHRVGFVVALLYLTKHSLYQYHRFMGPKP